MALLEQNIARQPYPAESYVFSRFAGVAYVKTFTGGLAFFVSCFFPLDMNETRYTIAWHKPRYEIISQNGWKMCYSYSSAFFDALHRHRFCLSVNRRFRNKWSIYGIRYWKLKSSLEQMTVRQLV